MKSVLKPKLFNDESFDVKSRRDHELDSEREGELKASMKRSEAGAAFLRYIALAIVAGLLIKGLMPLNFSKYAVYVLNFKNVLDFLLGLAGEIYSNFIADKIYFSTLFLLMWLFYANYGLFRFFFIRNHMSLYNKGVALMDNKNYPAAVVSFESALKNFMPPLDMIKIRSELARCYLALANYDLCIYNCNKVLEADGGNDAAAETIARAYLENDDRGETAVKFYIGLFNQGFSDSRMVKILCSHFMSSNDISDTALTVYKKAMEHSPDDALLRNMLFKACVISNDRSGYALELYEKIFSDEPDRTDVMLALVTAYYNAKNYKKCALMCRQLFDRREIQPIAFRLLRRIDAEIKPEAIGLWRFFAPDGKEP